MTTEWRRGERDCQRETYVGSDVQCSEPAMPGKDHCNLHRPRGAEARALNAPTPHVVARVPKREEDPPFDGSDPCPMCPAAIRHLFAVAHNTVTAWESRPHKVAERMHDLKEAVQMVQPYADAHFADSMHARGEVARPVAPRKGNDHG